MRQKMPVLLAVLAAYVLLLVLWFTSRGVAHTYEHWIGSVEAA